MRTSRTLGLIVGLALIATPAAAKPAGTPEPAESLVATPVVVAAHLDDTPVEEYRVRDAGVVWLTVTRRSGLDVVRVRPADGWTYEVRDGARRVAVWFVNRAEGRATVFLAHLTEDGETRTRIEERDRDRDRDRARDRDRDRVRDGDHDGNRDQVRDRDRDRLRDQDRAGDRPRDRNGTG